MYTQKELDTLHSALLEMQEELETLVDHTGFNNSETASVGELSSIDNHPADLGTELYEREKDLALNIEFQDQQSEVQLAFQKWANGTYGQCETCGKEIPFERLEALPTARWCIEHVPTVEGDPTPVEQHARQIPSISALEIENHVSFDGEDSWQSVAKYGTSETQSDQTTAASYDYNHMYLDGEEQPGIVEFTDLFGRNEIERHAFKNEDK
ncbi:MAG: TraR/DksA C4-type zinc finger protein [Bacilli bacterium]